ncbi:PqqD family protein [Aeromicrobium sp. CF4.19]|uniref:PqqD family protein n=1 Tax=Aeromicrobium sp. CF4.19 TaxID=3373082 RepID=UPI003EE6A402
MIDQGADLSYAREDVVTWVDGARYGDLNACGRFVLDVVSSQGQVTLGRLADMLSTTYGIDEERAFGDVGRFVHQAQVAGVLSMRSSWRQQVQHSLVRPFLDLAMFPVRLNYPARGARRRHLVPSVAVTARAALESQVALGVVLLVPFAAVIAIALAPPDPLLFVAAFGGVFLLTMAVTGVVHELAHHVVAGACGLRLDIVYRERFTVGLRRERGSSAQEALITVIGPVAALALVITALLTLGAGSWDGQAGFVVRCAVLGLLAAGSLHLACLVPPSADGRALVRAVKDLRT